MIQVSLDYKRCFGKVHTFKSLRDPDEQTWRSLANQKKPTRSKEKKCNLSIEEVGGYHQWLSQLEKNNRISKKQKKTCFAIKARLIGAVAKSVKEQLEVIEVQKRKKKNKKNKLMRLGFGIFAGLGIIYGACIGLGDTVSLLSLFAVPKLAVIIPSLILGGVGAFTFTLYELQQIRQALNISYSDTPSYMRSVLDSQQAVSKAFQLLVDNFEEFEKEDIEEYIDVLGSFKKDIDEKNDLIKTIAKPSLGHKLLRWTLTGLAASMAGYGGFLVGQWSAVCLLGLLSIATGGPLGVAVVGGLGAVCASVAIVTFLYLDSQDAFNIGKAFHGLPRDPVKKFKVRQRESNRLSSDLKSKLACHRYKEENSVAAQPYYYFSSFKEQPGIEKRRKYFPREIGKQGSLRCGSNPSSFFVSDAPLSEKRTPSPSTSSTPSHRTLVLLQ